MVFDFSEKIARKVIYLERKWMIKIYNQFTNWLCYDTCKTIWEVKQRWQKEGKKGERREIMEEPGGGGGRMQNPHHLSRR